jgi:ribosomal protein S18 acetylase RimI-like enzyme
LQWPQLCYVALARVGSSSEEAVVGVIVCKQDVHRSGRTRGYIAMLAVHHSMRKRGMGSRLVSLAVNTMRGGGCDEAVLETEVTNIGALRLYEGLGFVRDKRLHKYYLNGLARLPARRPPAGHVATTAKRRAMLPAPPRPHVSTRMRHSWRRGCSARLHALASPPFQLTAPPPPAAQATTPSGSRFGSAVRARRQGLTAPLQ